MSVAIAGMHRSGTSMVARLLNQCGLYLGNPNQLIGAGRGNPEGHWEREEFVRINEAILDANGCGWDLPPREPIDWAAASLNSWRDEGVRLVASLSVFEPWGWKDPRTCLTLPFWLNLLSDLVIVIPVRDPLDVAASLHQRNLSSRQLSLELWLAYHKSILASAPTNQRMVAMYDDLLNDPAGELRRLLSFAGIPAPPETVLAACHSVRRNVSRSRPASDRGPNMPRIREALELYEALSREAQVGRGAPHSLASAPTAVTPKSPNATLVRARQVGARSARRVLGGAMGVGNILELQSRRLDEAERQLAERIRWEAEILPKREMP